MTHALYGLIKLPDGRYRLASGEEGEAAKAIAREVKLPDVEVSVQVAMHDGYYAAAGIMLGARIDIQIADVRPGCAERVGSQLRAGILAAMRDYLRENDPT